MTLLVAVGILPTGCGKPGTPPCSLRDDAPFRLAEAGDGFEIRYRWQGRSAAVPVPQGWLVPSPAEDADGWETFPSHPYEEAMTAFQVDGALLGLHLAAYAVQTEGSMQLGLGRDLFLLLDPGATRFVGPPLRLGTTQRRVRFMGCWQALQSTFRLADIDADGACDIGVERERIRCTEVEWTDEFGEVTDIVEGPCAQRDLARWFPYRGARWVEDPSAVGLNGPKGAVELPRIGVAFGPVDYVRRMGRRPIPECVKPSPFASD